MYKKILVTLDGSPVSEAILDELENLADSQNEIHLLRVVNAHTLPGADASEAQVRALGEAERYLEQAQERLREAGIKVKSHVCFGRPAEEILAHAAHWKYDLIAMTTHGRTGVGRLVLGSVTESVIRKSGVPVLVLRTREGEEARETEGASPKA